MNKEERKNMILLEKSDDSLNFRIGKEGKKEFQKQAKEKGFNNTQYLKHLITSSMK